jgi:putative ABC transport system substrate-binding protein
MIQRREFITLLGGAAATWPIAARGQQPRRIGGIVNGAASDGLLQSSVATFEQGLRALGWRNGQNLHIDYRWYTGNVERARADAAELIALTPDLIVTSSSTVLTAVMGATKTIPIVFTSVIDPVTQGFVPSLAHPGGNVTGFATLEYSVGGKWLDLLKQGIPSLASVAFMFNPDSFPQFKFFLGVIEAAAPSFGVTALPLPIHNRADIEPAIASLASQPNVGLIVPTDTSLVVHHEEIVERVSRYRVPAIYARREYVDVGGLMFYGTVGGEAWHGAAIYVDRILRGAKPGDLPVQTPVNFRFVVNVKAARALGIELPMSLMLRADEMIE